MDHISLNALPAEDGAPEITEDLAGYQLTRAELFRLSKKSTEQNGGKEDSVKEIQEGFLSRAITRPHIFSVYETRH